MNNDFIKNSLKKNLYESAVRGAQWSKVGWNILSPHSGLLLHTGSLRRFYCCVYAQDGLQRVCLYIQKCWEGYMFYCYSFPIPSLLLSLKSTNTAIPIIIPFFFFYMSLKCTLEFQFRGAKSENKRTQTYCTHIHIWFLHFGTVTRMRVKCFKAFSRCNCSPKHVPSMAWQAHRGDFV